MMRNHSYLKSTIGRKQIVAVTGLGLALFVLAHMAGNMLIFISPEAYNLYGHKLTSNPLIYVAEAGLLAIFLFHLGLAIKLTFENRSARKQTYAKAASGDKATSWIQKTMIHQGLLILVFVILHLLTFKYGTTTYVEIEGEKVRDLHSLIIEVFHMPIYVYGYLFALFVLGLHLSHGISSSIQTLGFHHPKYQSKIKCASWIYAIVVAGGFISQPIYVYFFHAG